MVYEIISVSKTCRRREYIDTSKNQIFMDCKNAEDVELRYLAFWQLDTENDNMKALAYPMPKIKSQGSNWGIKIIEAKGVKTA